MSEEYRKQYREKEIELQMNQEKYKKNNRSIENWKTNKRRLNLAKQLRSESAAVFPCIHDEKLPFTDDRSPYVLLKNIPEDVKRNFGRQIFDRVINYLRLLAMKELFPHGSILNQVLIRLDESKKAVESINLSPTFLSTLPQSLNQIKELQEFLYLREALPESNHTIDYYFPPNQIGIAGQLELEDVACIVDCVDQIDLVNNIGMQFISGGQLLTAEDLLRLLGKQLCQQGENDSIWLLMARFCVEHQAIGHLSSVPAWMSEYVQYQNAKPLPDIFVDNAMSNQPLEMLRMCLGMYPTDLGIHADLPGNLNAHLKELPVWY